MKATLLRERTRRRAIEAFELRYVEKLKLRECGVRLGRVDGSGPIGAQAARQLVMRGMRMLLHPDRRDHPWREIAEDASAALRAHGDR